jgi:transcriptional regulator with XRE-family HTH domain
MIAVMGMGTHIQAWRSSKGYSLDDLALETGISPQVIEEIESGDFDPSVSTLETLAAALKIPVAWLFTHPTMFQQLFQQDLDEDGGVPSGPDPVTQRILSGTKLDRSLYVLLTALVQSAEPKLLRAAEVSLQSLLKQSKQSPIPWLNRPSGHFEPPSD